MYIAKVSAVKIPPKWEKNPSFNISHVHSHLKNSKIWGPIFEGNAIADKLAKAGRKLEVKSDLQKILSPLVSPFILCLGSKLCIGDYRKTMRKFLMGKQIKNWCESKQGRILRVSVERGMRFLDRVRERKQNDFCWAIDVISLNFPNRRMIWEYKRETCLICGFSITDDSNHFLKCLGIPAVKKFCAKMTKIFPNLDHSPTLHGGKTSISEEILRAWKKLVDRCERYVTVPEKFQLEIVLTIFLYLKESRMEKTYLSEIIYALKSVNQKYSVQNENLRFLNHKESMMILKSQGFTGIVISHISNLPKIICPWGIFYGIGKPVESIGEFSWEEDPYGKNIIFLFKGEKFEVLAKIIGVWNEVEGKRVPQTAFTIITSKTLYQKQKNKIPKHHAILQVYGISNQKQIVLKFLTEKVKISANKKTVMWSRPKSWPGEIYVHGLGGINVLNTTKGENFCTPNNFPKT